MAQLRQDYAQFVDRNVEVVVLGPEDGRSFKAYFQKESLPFIGLPDPEHRVLRLYGQEVKWLKLGRMPAQALLDRNGIVRHIHYGHDMTDIASNAQILALVDEIDAGPLPLP